MMLRLTSELSLDPADVSTLAWDSDWREVRTLVITMKSGKEHRVSDSLDVKARDVERLLFKAIAAARD